MVGTAKVERLFIVQVDHEVAFIHVDLTVGVELAVVKLSLEAAEVQRDRRADRSLLVVTHLLLHFQLTIDDVVAVREVLDATRRY